MPHLVIVIFKSVLIGALVSLVLSLILRRNTRQASLIDARKTQSIGPDRTLYGTLAVLFACLSIAAIVAALTHLRGSSQQTFALVIAFGLAGGVYYLVPFMRSVYQVNWDDTGLTGPQRHLPYPLGPARVNMPYRDIVDVGCMDDDNFFVEGPDGEVIRFSYLFRGFNVLMERLEKERPDLF